MPAKLVWLQHTATDLPTDPTSDPRVLTSLDFGNVIAPGEKTLPFKLGNVGDATAEDITLSMVGPSGDLAYSWKYLSVDGGASFTPAPLSETPAAIGNLAPGILSDNLLLKSKPPAISDTVPTGVHASTLVVDYVYV